MDVNVFDDVHKNVKHRANDASNDVHRPPLPPPKELGDKIVSNQHIQSLLLALESSVDLQNMISCDKNCRFAEDSSSPI